MMNSTDHPRRNEIYMAKMFFSDLQTSEDRPVIIMSKNSYNENYPDVMVCGLTTNSTHSFHLRIDKTDLEKGGLLPESGARADMIGRLIKTNLKFKIGKITDEYHRKLLDKIIELIK